MGDGLIANEIHDAAGVTGKGRRGGGRSTILGLFFFSFSTRHTQMTPSVDNSGLLRNSHPPCKLVTEASQCGDAGNWMSRDATTFARASIFLQKDGSVQLPFSAGC